MPASRAQQAKTAERRRSAIAMALAGADWDTIADRLGYASKGAAHTDVTRAMEKAAAEATRDADVLRHIELARIARMQVAYWPRALGGRPPEGGAVLPPDPDAAKVVQWCIDRRCKLLGLDAPTRHEVVTLGAIEAAIAQLEQDLAAGGPGAVPAGADPAGAALPPA
jgi:hypothetical protein